MTKRVNDYELMNWIHDRIQWTSMNGFNNHELALQQWSMKVLNSGDLMIK